MKRFRGAFALIQSLVGIAAISLHVDLHACTRVLLNAPDHTVMVARSMDWEEDMQTRLLVLPRQFPHTGSVGDNPDRTWLSWKSLYGSIVATGYENLINDGLNEAGFAAHLLWHEGADYGVADPKQPALSQVYWLLFYLDNFSTVREAVEYTRAHPFQVVPFYHEETAQWGKLHLVLDDASGDSAVMEYVAGKLKIWHGPQYRVVTNEPDYDAHLKNLRTYRGFGGQKPLPGTFNAKHRFVRASYYTKFLPEFASDADQRTGLLAILNNVAYPFTRIDETKTWWRALSDLTHRIYYFQSTQNQNLLWADLAAFDFANPRILILDLVNHPELAGDVGAQFEGYDTNASRLKPIQINPPIHPGPG